MLPAAVTRATRRHRDAAPSSSMPTPARSSGSRTRTSRSAGQHHQGDDGRSWRCRATGSTSSCRSAQTPRPRPPSKIGLRAGPERRPPRPALRRAAQVGERRSGGRGRGRRRLRVEASRDRMNLKARVVGATHDQLRQSARAHRVRPRHDRARPGRDLPLRARRSGLPRGAAARRPRRSDRRPERPSTLALVRSHNRLLNAPDFQVIGKTGYTRPARRCFVGAAGQARARS